jgi:hypothetical protein
VDPVGRVLIDSTAQVFYLVGPNEGFGFGPTYGSGDGYTSGVDDLELQNQVVLSPTWNMAGSYAMGTMNGPFANTPTETGVLTANTAREATLDFDLNSAGKIQMGTAESGGIVGGSPGLFMYIKSGQTKGSLQIFFTDVNHALLLFINRKDLPALSEMFRQ